MSEESFVDYDEPCVKLKKEYFCTTCKCILIELFKDLDFYSSDWIDFNG